MDKNNEIDRILINSSKGELIEVLTKELASADKVIVICIEDKEDGKYASRLITLGLQSTYEAYGILEVAKQDLQVDDY